MLKHLKTLNDLAAIRLQATDKIGKQVSTLSPPVAVYHSCHSYEID